MARARTTSLITLLAAGLAACGGDAPPEAAETAEQGTASAAAADVVYGDDGFVAVGSPAPDFALRGATRFGVLAEPVSLSDYSGKTVVLAFFFRARGRG
ncbi:MAG: hypothetical protein WD101_00620 [Gemmatimonadota bacterium]